MIGRRSHHAQPNRRARVSVWAHFALVALLFPTVTIGCRKPPPAVAPVPPPPAPAPPPVTITAAPEAKVKALMSITASADINPDDGGRPSPVVLRIYQLRTDEMFKTASFDDLFDQEQRALGATLISRNEFRLRPSETRTVDVTVAPEARFVAALAAFRQINDARWRVFVPAPRGDFAVAIVRNAIEIRSTVQ